MRHYCFALLSVLVAASALRAQVPANTNGDALVQKIQTELGPPPPPETVTAQGEMIHGTISDSAIYPGTENGFQVYVPKQYDPAKPACLLVKLDGFGAKESAVLDSLIASKEVPVIIAVGISPGMVMSGPVGTPQRHGVRFNRCYEFDSTNDHFPDYVLNELLPAVEKLKTADGRVINISPDGNDHAAMGASSGGIGSFTLAWQRPDQFTRIYDTIGTFVSMRGGHEYPELIRKTEPKPIRIFLEDGSADAWNPLFGSWFEANQKMNSALTFAGYDVAHAWGTHGHDGRPGAAVLSDVLRWLWRDYPAPIKAGTSKNNMLVSLLPENGGWQKIDHEFQGASGLAANAKGEVYFCDGRAATIYHLGADDKATTFLEHSPVFAGEAFGPDGTLYGVAPGDKKVIALDSQGNSRTVADGIAGHNLVVTHDGTIYVSEPGEHSDMPSEIWQIKTDGSRKSVDQGLLSASGVAFSPDGGLFFASEKSTKWVYSYVVQPDGTFADKQPFDWLHMTDIPNDSGAEDIAVDTHGELYVATRMGVQVCDQNGRVRAILPLPTPCGPVRSLCFGGEHFDTLYVTDGKQVFKRTLKVPGHAPWAAPQPYPSEGAS